MAQSVNDLDLPELDLLTMAGREQARLIIGEVRDRHWLARGLLWAWS